MLAVEHAESAPITLWWIKQGRPCDVVQEALTFLGSLGTKSLSGLECFHVGQDKVDSSIQGSASVTPQTHLINCWGSRYRGSRFWLE